MLHLSENAREVLLARYLRRDLNGKILETPEELFERVATSISKAELSWGKASKAEEWRDQFLEMLSSLDFLPNSPTLMNAGTPLGQLSACFVLPVEDSVEEIFESLKQMAIIQRAGGGTGFSFSHLRPKGFPVSSTGGAASGPVSFMKIFDAATQHIRQGGRRRGANMGGLRVDHPDILEFVTAKSDNKSLQNFNISVAVTDSFIQAVRKNQKYDLLHPHTRRVLGSIKAREVFNAIVKAAWQTGDPGLLFLDRINRCNPVPFLGKLEATNPCGEIPLYPYEACNLGSIHLAHMLRKTKGRIEIDVDKLRDVTRKAIRFLDNVIEVNHYPFAEIRNMCLGSRKIGLGVMGFAEMLIRLEISYASPKAIKLALYVMKIIAEESRKASMQLVKERGVFPFWKKSTHAVKNIRFRNATLNAIAPTGTLSILANTSAGIEPYFALLFQRHIMEGKIFREIIPVFETYLREYKLPSKEILHKLSKYRSLSKITSLPFPVKKLFATALEISPVQHLKIQAAFQKYVDNSVSKTINLPSKASPEDIAHIYLQAWKLKLKGITIYRYGSKSSQVLEFGGSHCDPGECEL